MIGLREFLVKEILERIPREEWTQEHKELAKRLDYKGDGKQ